MSRSERFRKQRRREKRERQDARRYVKWKLAEDAKRKAAREPGMSPDINALRNALGI